MTLPTEQAVRMISIALIPKADMDLARIRERADLSVPDIVNRAITLYDFVDEQLASGAELFLRRGRSTYRVRLSDPTALTGTPGFEPSTPAARS